MPQVVLYCPTCDGAQTHNISPPESEAFWPRAVCGLCGTSSIIKRDKRRKCGCTPDGDHKVCPVCAGTMHKSGAWGFQRWACSSCAYDEVI